MWGNTSEFLVADSQTRFLTLPGLTLLGPTLRGPPFGAPTLRGPPFGCLFFHALFYHLVFFDTNLGQSWFGQSRPIQVGQSRYGQNRPTRMAKVGISRLVVVQSSRTPFVHMTAFQHYPPTNRASLSLAFLSVVRILLRLSWLRRRRSTESCRRGSQRCPISSVRGSCSSYILRVVHPEHSFQFALRHDAGIRQCLEILVHTPITQSVWEMASLPFGIGGLSLRHAERLRTTAYWSSWADTLPMIRQRHPQVADHILVSLSQGRRRESEPSHERRSGCTRVG